MSIFLISLISLISLTSLIFSVFFSFLRAFLGSILIFSFLTCETFPPTLADELLFSFMETFWTFCFISSLLLASDLSSVLK